MCGLVGVAGNLGFKEEKAFRNLIILDTLRGEDSTGVMFLTKSGHYSVCKELGNPFNLFETKRYEVANKKANSIIMGHNRYATVGNVTKRNAHPFEFDSLIGAHNGTLKNKHSLADSADFSVDSENLYHHIDKHGLKDAINNLDGAWALSWFDKVRCSMNFLRNKERTLSYAETLDGSSIIWASESWMISIAAGRADLKIKDIQAFPEDVHYEFEFAEKNWNVLKPRAKPMVSTYVNFPSSNYMGNWNRGSLSNTSVVAVGNVNKGPVSNVVPIQPKTEVVDPKKALVVQMNPSSPSQSELKLGFSEEVVREYSGRRNVSLAVGVLGRDEQGALYVNLLDPQRPLFPIRMYLPKNHEFTDKANRKVMVDIGEYIRNKSKIPFFKVSINNCIFVEERGSVGDAVPKYDNGNGLMLTKKEWENKFQFCNLCFEALDAADHGNRLAKDNGQWICVCPECVHRWPLELNGMSLKSVY